MKWTMVRYKVKADRVAENERYIACVFDQLKRERPASTRYVSFKLGDGVSLAHVASQEPADGRNALAELSAFKAFTASVRERCDEPPIAVELNDIGSYGVFSK